MDAREVALLTLNTCERQGGWSDGVLKKQIAAAGLDSTQYSAHKLRHTAATLMLQNGVDVRTLQEVLGHDHLNTTQIYTHVDNDDLRTAARANPLGKVKKRGKIEENGEKEGEKT